MEANLLQKVGKRLESWPRTMVLSHRQPDGDALGAMGAMKRIITAGGREATAFIESNDLGRYQFLQAACGFAVWPEEDPTTRDSKFDGILILDTCSWSQLEPFADFLRASSLPKIVVDHHTTRDVLSNDGDDDMYWIESSSASACEMIYQWATAMNWPIDEQTAEVLMTGMATDTGWFRFSNTDGDTLRAAADLIERGVLPHRVYGELYETSSPARLRLKAAMLSTLEFHANETLAVLSLTKAMFDQTGATPSEAEDLVNEPMETGSVVVAVLLTDMAEGPVRVSLRSKAPEVCGCDIDVAAIAQPFGGGGHRRAAGARINGTLDEVRSKVVAAVVAAMS